MYGGIEAGGTKFVCAVSDEGVIVEKISIPTTAPEETLKQVFDFFDQYELEAMGIGSFGPIGIDKSTDSYGYVLATPKKGWTNYNFLGSIKDHYDIPVAWTTDVNAAAYGELLKGAAIGKKKLYLFDCWNWNWGRRSDRWKHLFRNRTSRNGTHLGQETSRRYV